MKFKFCLYEYEVSKIYRNSKILVEACSLRLYRDNYRVGAIQMLRNASKGGKQSVTVPLFFNYKVAYISVTERGGCDRFSKCLRYVTFERAPYTHSDYEIVNNMNTCCCL